MTPQQAIMEAQRLLNAGNSPAAESLLQSLIWQRPDTPHASHLLGIALLRQRKFDPAIYHLERAAAAEPDSTAVASALATALSARDRHEDALRLWDRLLDRAPANIVALNGRGITLASMSRFTEAAAAFDRVLALDPSQLPTRRNRATLLTDIGLMQEAAAELRQALELAPGDPILLSDLAGALNYIDGPTPDEVLATHKAIAAAVEPRAPRLTVIRDREPERRLRVGYLSSDLRAHSVASFMEPLLRHHGRAQIEVSCYFTGHRADATTARLRPLADHWRDVATLDDASIARQIRDDGIDILIELNGLTHGHRLGVMACRPAPVQATYCGYPNTTGFASIDYRIVDSLTDAPGADARAVERLFRLDPCFLCYQPPSDAPAAAPPPSLATGAVTFGSFNMIQKISDATLRLWSTVLARTPHSRLLLKAKSLDHPDVRSQILRRAAAAGIDEARLDLIGHLPSPRDHLQTYARVDIALDTFPYHGTTTTCESLWMGVPVVSRFGDVHASRVGLSLLSAIGLPDLAADSDDAFTETAAALAADPARLASLRASLRERVQSSPLCDAPAFAKRFDDALRQMWREWCARA